jgi:hypothetical protein
MSSTERKISLFILSYLLKINNLTYVDVISNSLKIKKTKKLFCFQI